MTHERERPDPWLRAFAEASPDATVVFATSGTIRLVNERARALFGYGEADLEGSPVGRLFSHLLHLDPRGRSSGVVLELEGTRRDGTTFPAHVSLTPMSTQPPMSIALVRDVSDARRAEQDRAELLVSERAARSEAERVSMMKDEFLATLSHELRTPLNAMLGWVQILQKHGADAELSAKAVETIERNIRVQARLIDELLDMSRIESGKLRLELLEMQLAGVLQAALAAVEPAAENRGVRLTHALDADAGSVRGDPQRIQQAVWNLLSNAVKFTPRGGSVRLTLTSAGPFARIEVADTGVGIDPAFLPHLFDRFRQADASTTRAAGGLGLGLSIVRSLVEMHGGTVHAESAGPGAGSTFIVMLPRAAAVCEAESFAAADPPRHAPSVPLSSPELIASIRGVRVLVVEDEPDARDFLRRVIEDFHAEVIVAASASEALEALREHHPDVLLCDIGMPGEDGYQLIRRIRALDPEHGGRTPAAALTAYTRERDRELAVALGFQLHVGKPIEPAHLAEIIAALVKAAPRDA